MSITLDINKRFFATNTRDNKVEASLIPTLIESQKTGYFCRFFKEMPVFPIQSLPTIRNPRIRNPRIRNPTHYKKPFFDVVFFPSIRNPSIRKMRQFGLTLLPPNFYINILILFNENSRFAIYFYFLTFEIRPYL